MGDVMTAHETNERQFELADEPRMSGLAGIRASQFSWDCCALLVPCRLYPSPGSANAGAAYLVLLPFPLPPAFREPPPPPTPPSQSASLSSPLLSASSPAW